MERHYVHSTKAWYWESAVKETCPPKLVDEIYFYNDEPYGEMAMRWYNLQDGEESPRLEVYIQSAAALVSLTDVLTDLGRVSKNKEDKSFTPEKFIALLERCGFVDGTPYTYEDSYPERGKRRKRDSRE